MAPYRFGVFELDASAGELRKQGIKIHLQGQPIEILTILLQHPGEVVTREELQKKLWPADTFVEFDAGLNAAIKRLRAALNDDPATPHYVETIPRKGYRFIANSIASDHDRGEHQIVIRAVELPGQWHGWLLAASAIAVMIFGVIAIRFASNPGRPRLISEGDTILMADFVNRTGDDVFDGTLKQGLNFHLAQSPYINLAAEDRVRQTLRQMNHPAEEPIVREVAREVCQRLNLKAMLNGEIVPLGSHYAITLNVINCLNGELLASEQIEASRKEEVLSALGKSASRLRPKLGEAVASVAKLDKPLEEATTSSLEALRQFSLGGEIQGRGKIRDSIPCYTRAIEIDPDFALAYMRLGAVYMNISEMEKAREHRAKAFALRARVSDRERLRISAGYYLRATGELDKAREANEQIIALYPTNWGTRGNLGLILGDLGELDKAIELHREEISRFPNSPQGYQNLVASLLAIGKIGDAKALLDRQIAHGGLETVYMHRQLYVVAFLQQDQAAMQREVSWAKGRPDEHLFLSMQADFASYLGRRKESMTLYRRATEMAKTLGAIEPAANYLATAARMEALFGNCQQARILIASALALHRPGALEGAPYVFATCGDAGRAQALLKDLMSRFPRGTLVNQVTVPEVHAILETGAGLPSRAIELLLPSESFEPTWWGLTYARGCAYLKAKSGKDAAREFEKIIAPMRLPSTTEMTQRAISYLQLSRAYVLADDIEKARKSYESFLELWKHADPDIPVLRKAKAEYAKLRKK